MQALVGKGKLQPSGVHLKEGFCGVFGVPYFLEVDVHGRLSEQVRMGADVGPNSV